MRVKRADLYDFAPRTPAQRVDGVAARRQEMAAAAGAGPYRVPPGIPVGHPREILRSREPNLAQPPRLAASARTSGTGCSAARRDHRLHASRLEGVADADELRLVEAGRLLEHEVLARPRRSHGLRGVQVVLGVAIEMMSTSGASSKSVSRRQAGVGSDRRCFSSVARARSRSRPWSQVTRTCGFFWNAVMCCAAHQPIPDTRDTKFSITSRHRLSLD